MDTPESIAEELRRSFPGPHEREPANLRRDIEDELADHLALANARERAKGLDDQRARSAAIERFGNPRKIARQLWFQAMKEQIMKDRLIIAVNILLAVVVIIAAVTIWRIADQSRQTNQSLVAALEKLATARASGPAQMAPTLASLNVHCTEREPNGPPAANLSVLLRGKPFTESEEELQQYTDASGNLTFGPVRPGKYRFCVRARDAAKRELNMDKEVVLYAGQPIKQECVIPDLQLAPATVSVALPDQLKKQNAIVTLRLFKKQMSVHGGLWYFEGYEVAVTPDGKLHPYGGNYRGQLVSYSVDPDKVTSLTLPAGEVYLSEIGIGINPERKEGATSLEYKAVARREYDEGSFPVFRIQAGTANQLNIQVPANLLKEARAARILSDSGIEKGSIDTEFLAQLPENAKRIISLETTGAVSEKKPSESVNFGLTNNGGSAIYVSWPNVPAEDAVNPNHKFLLALYAAGERFSFKNESETKGAIVAETVTTGWHNGVDWGSKPKTAPTDPPARFDITPGTGWKLFDITPMIRAQANSGQRAYGFMLRFDKPAAPGQDWSSYDFSNIRDRAGRYSPTRPVVIEIGQ